MNSCDSTSSIISLIGFRGSGKTTVGKELARVLAGDVIDTDELVTKRAGRSIAEIFAAEGEDGFRRHESQAVLDAIAAKPAVISVGGGAVFNRESADALRSSSTVVWLVAPAEELWRRISTDPSTTHSRPPLGPRIGREGVEHLLAQRAHDYAELAGIEIDTTNKTPDEVARLIVRKLQDRCSP